MAGMAARPHKETCRHRTETHLENEEHPRWKKNYNAKEKKFWEVIQEAEDKMKSEKVGNYHVTKEVENTTEKRPAEETGGAGTSNNPNTASEKKLRLEEKHGEKRRGEEEEQQRRRQKIEEPKGEKRKEIETEFEQNLRCLDTQAANLGLTTAELWDL